MTREELDKEKEEIFFEIMKLSKTSSGKRKFHSNLQKRIVVLRDNFYELYGECRGRAGERKGFNVFIADLQISPSVINRWNNREKEIASIDVTPTDTMDVVRNRSIEQVSTPNGNEPLIISKGLDQIVFDDNKIVYTGPNSTRFLPMFIKVFNP